MIVLIDIHLEHWHCLIIIENFVIIICIIYVVCKIERKKNAPYRIHHALIFQHKLFCTCSVTLLRC